MITNIVLGDTKIVPLNKLKLAWDQRCVRLGADPDSQSMLHSYWVYCNKLRSEGYVLLSKHEAISARLLGVYNQ